VNFLILIGVIIVTVVVALNSALHTRIAYKGNARKLTLLFGSVVLVVASLLSSISVIDAGEVGVKVLFGSVSKSTVKEGINFINPFARVVKYSIRLKEYTMSKSVYEGQRQGDDSMTARTINNTEVRLDMTVWYKIDPTKAYRIYKKIASNDERLSAFIRPVARAVVRDVVATYTNFTHLNNNRFTLRQSIQKQMGAALEDKGIHIDRALVRTITPPKEVDEAINRKLKRQQEIEERQYSLKIAEKDRQIRIVEAKGVADAQRIINRTLTFSYLQYMAIKAQEKMAKSPNHTTVYIPVGPNGMPLIKTLK